MRLIISSPFPKHSRKTRYSELVGTPVTHARVHARTHTQKQQNTHKKICCEDTRAFSGVACSAAYVAKASVSKGGGRMKSQSSEAHRDV